MSEKLTAIIVDDDPEAIKLLELYLRAYKEIEVIATTTLAEEASRLIEEKYPNLVFLDIDMPGKNGLQVAQTIQRYTPLAQIVFTTAHLHYAYDALEVQPLDFLTKPFGPDSLATIIRKYHIRMEQIHSAQKVELFMHQNEPENKVKLLTQSGLVFINPKEVVCLNATLRHTNVYVLDGACYSVSGTINKVFAALASPNLIRIGRSVCLNIQYIKKIDKKNRICYLTYGAKLLEQQLSQSHLAVLNRINNISI